MKVFIKTLIILLIPCYSFGAEYIYILNDKCIDDLYNNAVNYFQHSKIKPIRDSRGLILRLNIEDFLNEFYRPNLVTYKEIENFLAKIENPAIIEVHTGDFSSEEVIKLKKWEISTIMANNIEAIITKPAGTIDQNRINSIGYGEFLPAKNTPYNGGKYSGRIDIIILCNISGE